MDEISELLGRQLTFYNHITHKSGSVSCLPKGREFDLALLEAELKGKTLLVYWYMLRASGFKVGVREVQRKLGFSSPSVAVYHLDKLESLGLVEKTVTGEYVLTSQVKTGLLRFFTRFGRFLVPRYMFYSVWFTTMLVSYIIFYGQSFCIHNVAALIFGLPPHAFCGLKPFDYGGKSPFDVCSKV